MKNKTTVGEIDPEILAFTVGKDVELDKHLVTVDCLGTAAHVTMLSKLPIKPPLFTAEDLKKTLAQLAQIARKADIGKFKITLADQDVHLAVERELTTALGDLGKKVHTARSRNDQVAVDLRLYGKMELISILESVGELANTLLLLTKKHLKIPMAGRTHMQPAMPSSVGLWASAFAESLLEDMHSLLHVYERNDQCPLGSAAGYGVPIKINRQLVSDLLGFKSLCHNVLYASNARGKVEGAILNVCSLVMVTLSRIAQDLMIFTMPEFGYFSLPPEFCTGSSMMPNKTNPDVLELIRAKAVTVQAEAGKILSIISSAPSGYNRDLQETKEPFIEGLQITKQSVRILTQCLNGLKVNTDALLKGFRPEVFATDWALELVGEGIPFRDAYDRVKEHLDELEQTDPVKALKKKTHIGATAGLDIEQYHEWLGELQKTITSEKKQFEKVRHKLLPM